MRQADLTVLLVNHDAFAGLDPKKLARLVRRRVVLDTRGVLDRAQWEAAGFTVVVLGEGLSPLPGKIRFIKSVKAWAQVKFPPEKGQ